MNDVLFLSPYMAQNYIALQNFLNNNPQKVKNRGESRGGKNCKRQERKVYLLGLQDFKCFDCGLEFIKDPDGYYSTATRDHIIPRRFGSTLDHNSVYVCDPCNQIRIDNPLPFILDYFGTIY